MPLDFPEIEYSHEVGYSLSRIDRMAAKRPDAAFLEAAKSAPDTGFVLFAGDRVVVDDAAGPHPHIVQSRARALELGLDLAEAVFLGAEDGAIRFAGAIDPDHAAATGTPLGEIRTLAAQAALGAHDLGLLAQARSLVHWHRTHGYCSVCGTRSHLAEGGYRRDCPSCGASHFPRTDPVAIMLAVRGDFCLMGRQPRFAPGMYSCLAGFIEPGETIEDAVRREIHEEAGIRTGRVRYLASQPWPFPSSLMIGCLVEAASEAIVIDEAELEDARWFSRDEVLAMIEGRHEAGLTVPPPFAIAHRLIRFWCDITP